MSSAYSFQSLGSLSPAFFLVADARPAAPAASAVCALMENSCRNAQNRNSYSAGAVAVGKSPAATAGGGDQSRNLPWQLVQLALSLLAVSLTALGSAASMALRRSLDCLIISSEYSFQSLGSLSPSFFLGVLARAISAMTRVRSIIWSRSSLSFLSWAAVGDFLPKFWMRASMPSAGSPVALGPMPTPP